MQYELFYLVGSSKEGELETIKKEVSEIVTLEGGVFLEKQTEEKRKLSYEVKHESHGIYIAQRFEMEEPSQIQEINRKLNLYTGVLRFIISKADELPELLSKEERKAKSSSENQVKTINKKEIVPTKEVKVESQKEITPTKEEVILESEAKKEADEDIDKKLEELLNI